MYWTDIIQIVTGLLIIIPQVVFDFSIPCVAISVSLNVLLTLMIVIRLALHGRNIRAASGSPAGFGGLYKAVATMLIESSALYAVNSLLLIGLWVANSGAADIFLPIVAETQVRAFPRPRPSGRLSNATMDRIGHRSVAHH